jgi:RNA polymerase sigma-70 factor (ECF subfamily)
MSVCMTEPTHAASAGRPHLHLVGHGAGLESATRLDLTTIYRLHSAYVATVGLRLLGNDAELDDLVQEVFIEAHHGLAQLRDPGAVRGWLARICVRKSVRRLRRRRLREMLQLQDVPEWQSADTSLTPEQMSEVKRAYRILAHFPAEERVVWILRHIEGESLDEMAQLCECSKSTVQRRIRAAEARFNQEARR